MTYAEKKAAGLCVRCGEKPAEPGAVSCLLCTAKLATNRKPQLSRPAAAGAWNDCCQVSGFHRFDCKEKPKGRRA